MGKFFGGGFTIRTRHFALQVVLISLFSVNALFAQPTISTISPTSGPVGTVVTITGSGFNNTPSLNTVYFGDVKGTVSTSSATSLKVAVPVGATLHPISVTADSLTAFSNQFFDVTFSGGGAILPTSFAPAQNFPLPISSGYPSRVYADMDGDGKPDLVVLNAPSLVASNFSVYRNTSTVGNISFGPNVDFTTADQSTAIVVGDLNGDGKLDVVITHTADFVFSVSVFINTSSPGNISFANEVVSATTNYSSDVDPNSLLIADVDGDGRPDLIATSFGSNMAIFKNTTYQGTVVFASPVLFAAGVTAEYVAMGDIDGDGKPDLAVSSSSGSTISVLRNLSVPGTINFATKVDYSPGSGTYTICMGDVDGDGKLDICAVNANASTLSILRNNSTPGTVAFDTISFPTGSYPERISIADFDGDGKPDLVANNLNDGNISVYRNLSAGGVISFSPGVSFGSSLPYTNTIYSGDLDGDGSPDIALNSASAALFLRNVVQAPNIISFFPTIGGPGTVITIKGTNFKQATTVSIGGTVAVSFSIISDTVITAVVGQGASGNISVTSLIGTGSLPVFTFTATPVITSVEPPFGPAGTTVVLTGANFNSVAANDVIYFGATRAPVSAASANSITVKVPAGSSCAPISVTNTSNGLSANANLPYGLTIPNGSVIDSASFTRTIFPAGFVPIAFATGDIDGDGKPDLILSDGYAGATTLSILRNTTSNGVMSFAAGVNIGNGTKVNVADFDGDGKLDLVFIIDGYLSFLRNTSTIGNISFAAAVNIPTSADGVQIAIGDLDGDGKPDIAVANSGGNGSIGVYRNTGTLGNIAFAAQTIYNVGSNPDGIAIADLDGDHRPDILVANSADNTISIYPNNSSPGTINFASYLNYPPITLTTGGGPIIIGVADFDGDGKPDFAVSEYNTGTISVFKNTSAVGAISFAGNIEFPVDAHPYSLITGDLDGDGKPDIVAANKGSGNISIYKNTSGNQGISFSPKIDFVTGNDPNDVFGGDDMFISDIDGDGTYELGVMNADTSSYSIFKYKASSVAQRPSLLSFAPDSATTGDTVTLTGLNFNGVSAVSFGAVPATSFIIVSPAMIKAVVGTGASRDVVVQSPQGADTATGFIYLTSSPDTSSFLLQSFSGTMVNNLPVLSWTAKYEQTISSYIVERSTDSINFTGVGTVYPAGGSGTLSNSYVFTDSSAPVAKLYYRLEVISTFPNPEYSNTILIDKTQPFMVYPNPAPGLINVQFPYSISNSTIRIMDLAGRVVRSVRVAPGTTRVTIPLTGVLLGVYQLQWIDWKSESTRTILVQ